MAVAGLRQESAADIILIGMGAAVSVLCVSVALVTSFPVHRSNMVVAAGISLVVPVFAIGVWTDVAARRAMYSRWTLFNPVVSRRRSTVFLLLVIIELSGLSGLQPLFGRGLGPVLALIVVSPLFVIWLAFLRRKLVPADSQTSWWLRRFKRSLPELRTSLDPLASAEGIGVRPHLMPRPAEWFTIHRNGIDIGHLYPLVKGGVSVRVRSGSDAEVVKQLVERAAL